MVNTKRIQKAEDSLWELIENISYVRSFEGTADRDTLDTWHDWGTECATLIQSGLDEDYNASTKKSKVKKYDYMVLNDCASKFFDIMQDASEMLMGNRTSNSHSFFNRILRENYNIEGHTLVEMLKTLWLACQEASRDLDALTIETYDASAKKSKDGITKRAYELDNLLETHIKEVNGEKYGEGYLTDDGWYDNQKYTIVTMDEVKIGSRNFRMSSFGRGRVTFTHYKDMGNFYYRIVLSVPDDLSTPYDITWTVGDESTGYDGITSQSHEVYQTGNSLDGNAIVDTVNQCVREIKSEINRMEAEGYTASTKKSKDNTSMSFTDNVNKMRINNYARTGNINTVMKKRD